MRFIKHFRKNLLTHSRVFLTLYFQHVMLWSLEKLCMLMRSRWFFRWALQEIFSFTSKINFLMRLKTLPVKTNARKNSIIHVLFIMTLFFLSVLFLTSLRQHLQLKFIIISRMQRMLLIHYKCDHEKNVFLLSFTSSVYEWMQILYSFLEFWILFSYLSEWSRIKNVCMKFNRLIFIHLRKYDEKHRFNIFFKKELWESFK